MKMMKKNKMMRAASVLLVAVLLTTSIISGTFAKYVTESEASDSARVAKFGVGITATGNLFDKTYFAVDQSDNSNKPGGSTEESSDNKVLTVESSNDEKVVAPGTKSADNGLTFSITGKPEVDVKINFTLEEGYKEVFLGASATMPDRTTAKTDDAFDGQEIYYPIVYILKNKSGTVLASGTLKDIQDYLNGNSGEIYVDANTNLAESDLGTLTLTWEWPYNDDAASALANTLSNKYIGNNLTGLANRDKKDTLLGDLAAGTASEFWSQPIKNPTNPTGTAGDSILPVNGTDYNLTADVKISVSVTQVD